MSTFTDAELKQIRDDESVFTRVSDATRERLMRQFGNRLNDVLAGAIDLEGVIQTGINRAFSNVRSGSYQRRGSGSFHGYVYTVVMNTLLEALDHAGRSKRNPHRHAQGVDPNNSESKASSPAQLLALDDLLQECLKQPDQVTRTIWLLKLLGDTSAAEIHRRLQDTAPMSGTAAPSLATVEAEVRAFLACAKRILGDGWED